MANSDWAIPIPVIWKVSIPIPVTLKSIDSNSGSFHNIQFKLPTDKNNVKTVTTATSVAATGHAGEVNAPGVVGRAGGLEGKFF